MAPGDAVSRRRFVGGMAGALGTIGMTPAIGRGAHPEIASLLAPPQQGTDSYDALAKLAANENPYGPPASVMKAMTDAFKYANRYGYPDGGIVPAIAEHHGVSPANILLGAGSGELLDAAGTAFLLGGRKVISVEPTFDAVFAHVTGIKADAVKLPLQPDYCQDIPAIIQATKANYRDVGFVYLCNPNNPTGRIVTSQEVRQLLDGIPADVPVLIDEAYHHFVDNADYATSIPYVLEGRQVIVTRTFSKIAALAGMRLGYAVAPRELIRQMVPYTMGSINAIVKWGGVAALKDTESQATVKRMTLDLRKQTTTELAARGFGVIPSETNFFMVDIRRPVPTVIDAFRRKGVLVGRPFPPMMQHLRVSVGTADEMRRFMAAFKEIVG
jgi:histidinol-phosphate aminotransferase